MDKHQGKPNSSMGFVNPGLKGHDFFTRTMGQDSKAKVLLHSCCGPCSTACIERLAPDYDITVFYFNPSITEEEEYEKRKANQILFIDAFNREKLSDTPIKFIEGRYSPDEYLELIKGLEGEPEGGERCRVCFRQRLRETAKKAKSMNMDYFTTTLTVSPHKNYDVIAAIAKEAAEEFQIAFLDMDFKKKAGFQRSIQLSKEYELYRQDYCGCPFSKRDK